MLNEIDLSRTDLNLLVLFEAVMEERHVGRAAGRLNLTPSAVSHGLGRLRRLLGDPLFLKTPRGVVPTERAAALQPQIADILARVRGVVATAVRFDPRTARRRFRIGAPDGVSVVLVPPLLAALRLTAPGIDVAVRQLLPAPSGTPPDRLWQSAFAALDTRELDVAIIPSDSVPLRFVSRTLAEEDFVLVMRRGHPFAREPSLDRYCAEQHLVVSLTGDPHGFVDEVLAGVGRRRRVAATLPGFLFALAVLARTDLLAAVPRRLAAAQGEALGLAVCEAPLPLGRFRLNAILPAAAIRDEGVEWLLDLLVQTAGATPGADAPHRPLARGRPARG